MKTPFFLANELAAFLLPLLAITFALAVESRWRRKILFGGQLAALFCALMGWMLGLMHGANQTLFDTGFLSWRLDVLTSSIVLGITFIAAVVFAFSERYLGGDPSRDKFLCMLSLLAPCAACLVLTDNLILAFACWHLLSIGLLQIMLLNADSSRSPQTVFKYHLFSDVLFLLALVLVASNTQDIGFSHMQAVLPSLNNSLRVFGLAIPVSVGAFASILLVLSFSIKSAIFPFNGWLLATLNAPTPLSGLLHAGVVNVSAVMAWRLAPLLQEHPTVLLAWGLLAALSALVGTLCMSAQPDVKKKLVYSTVGQMGFMALQCASGAIGAALFHLLAHGLFKCYMFLQSGSAVAEGLDKRKFGSIQVDAVHSASSIWSKIFVMALGAAASIGLYVLCVNNGFTGISAAITACALFCGMPALERIDFKSLSLFWIAVMGIVLGGGLLSSTFEHLVQVGASANQWLLPLVLALFALISIALQIGRNSSLAKALYVHSLSGFYVDEISSGHSIAIATRQ